MLSEPFECTQGVKQGCVLSPVLFSLYINDLPGYLPGGVIIGDNKINILMYADDLVLLADSQADLQLMIDAFSSYCCTWGLEVNLSKTKVMVFRECARIPANSSWNFDGIEIGIVNTYKYLEVLLNYNLSYKKHLGEKLKTAKNAICSTWSKYIMNPKISVSRKLKIFETAANAILFYAAQVWGYKEYEKVEKLFSFFIKKMLFLPTNTPNYALYLETNMCSQCSKTLALHFSYIRKILLLPDNRLPHILAKEICRREISWFKEWKQICEKSMSLLLFPLFKICLSITIPSYKQ